jgi:Flp pilus assembly protein protease CpaA
VQPVQPSPPPSWYAFLTTYSSILFTLLLFVLAAVYAYTKREGLSQYQTWITLYLISLTGLLWALFVYVEGGPLADSVFIVTTVAGLNLIVHVLRFDRIEIPLPATGGTGVGGGR